MRVSTPPKRRSPQSGCQEGASRFGAVETNYNISYDDRAMPSDSMKTLDDLRGEGLFSVGGVKNPRFLFPPKKA